MSITLNLPRDTEQAINELAARRGQDAAAFILSLVDDALLFEGFEPVDANAPQERTEAVAGIQRGLDAFAAGRHRWADEVFADIQKRHGIR